MRRVEVSSHLDASPDTVWSALQRPDTLRYVSAPLIRFVPVDPPVLPELWAEGEYGVGMWFLGIVPIGSQTIRISWPDPVGQSRFIRDNGRGRLASRWDHPISVVPEGDGTRYTDRIEVEAGWLTGPVAGFARIFYAHRQRRLNRFLNTD